LDERVARVEQLSDAELMRIAIADSVDMVGVISPVAVKSKPQTSTGRTLKRLSHLGANLSCVFGGGL